MGTAAKSRRKIPGFHLDLDAWSGGGGSRGRYTIVAGRVLAPAGIGEVLVAWWLGMEVTPRRIELSRGRTCFPKAWRYRRDTCWGPIGASSWACPRPRCPINTPDIPND
ncbi:hypothetical protein RHMOL_Rhmol05G0277900 [Rhododendron molle]|uniref:Uncharacterized protein n=1 Tax=Rhododendron molle TaxID=49168 RepID=A0ACC0NVW3_RHOML|nr:hypothetical protein RHMOL_Rhmol05G0277900 [Rhododendron molle]